MRVGVQAVLGGMASLEVSVPKHLIGFRVLGFAVYG